MRLEEAIDEHIDHAFSALIEGPPRRRQLRTSGLPYCPILDSITPREPEYGDLNGTLYTTRGTAAHSGIQAFMSLGNPGKRVWGGWKCNVCGKKWTKNQFRPVVSCCGVSPEYVEVDFRVGPLTGHMDMVCNYHDRWWVGYEFKTIGGEPEKPKRQHVLQVRTYTAMLDLCYGIRPHAYVILYIDRGHLKRTLFGPYNARASVSQTRDWIFRSIRGFKAATRVLKDPSVPNIREMVSHRPCRSVEDHDDYMARKYEFSIKPCPLLSQCSRGDKAACGAVRDVLHAGSL